MKEKMKNTIRRVLSVFAAIAMVLGVMGANVTPVMADDPVEGNGGNYTITVKNANPNQTYNLYKIFDATSNSTRQGTSDTDENTEPLANGISYTLPSGRSLNTEYKYTDSNNVSHDVKGDNWFHVDEGGNVIKLNDGITTTQISSEDFKQWAMQFASPAVTTKKNDSESAADLVFSGLTDGYYFITTTTGSLVTVTSVAPAQTVKDKNGTPAVTKSEDQATNDIGKTVTYTVRINLVPGTQNVVFHDQLTAGLTLDGTAPTKMQVQGTDLATTNYTLTKWQNDSNDGQDDITITFAQNYLDSLKESTQVDLEYKATVNSQAVVNAHNDAFLKYGENNNIESTHIRVYESTFGFQVNKVDDSSTPKALSGARFVLSREASLGNLTEDLTDEQKSKLIKFDTAGRLTTLENGTYIQEGKGRDNNLFTFGGLDADKEGTTYYLYEVKAPEGYNKLTGPVEIKITPTFDGETTRVNSFKVSYKLPGSEEFVNVKEQNNEVIHQFDISNNQGMLLPSTGGIGTTIFYVIGGVIVAGAIVLLIARRRKNA